MSVPLSPPSTPLMTSENFLQPTDSGGRILISAWHFLFVFQNNVMVTFNKVGKANLLVLVTNFGKLPALRLVKAAKEQSIVNTGYPLFTCLLVLKYQRTPALWSVKLVVNAQNATGFWGRDALPSRCSTYRPRHWPAVPLTSACIHR